MHWNVPEYSAKVNMIKLNICREAGWCEEMAGNESHLVAFGCANPQKHRRPFP